jgi:hypothetical protein
MFLTAVDGPSGRLATYVYDSESKRRRIYEGAAFTTLVWDGWDYLQWRRPSGTHVFHTMNGEIVGESVGGVVRDYLLDPLGSVVATLDAGGLVDQFEYWPYGELVDDLPEGAPVFLWVGGLGYWFDTDERRYVRHRMLRTDLGSWMQVDPLWPNEASLGYVPSSPQTVTDSMGLQPEQHIPYVGLEGWGCYCDFATDPPEGFFIGKGTGRDKGCMQLACKEYCKDSKRAAFWSSKLCSSPSNCDEISGSLKVCTYTSPVRPVCLALLTGPKDTVGGYSNGEPGGPSDPKSGVHNSAATEWYSRSCCVECRIRLCCATLSPAYEVFKKRVSRC